MELTPKNEINIPLLRKAIEWIEEQDALPREVRQWDQGNWVTPESDRVEMGYAPGCGTAYCVAGWIAKEIHPELADTNEALIDGKFVSTQQVAGQALGLPLESCGCCCEDNNLFYSLNTAADVRRIAEELAGEKL